MPTRRDFLKYSALLGTAATLSHLPIANAIAEETGAESEFYTVNMRSRIRAAKSPARTITIPDVDGFKVLKGDFHMHTLFSDGHVMPKDRIDEAVDNGLDVISITDHIEYRPYIGGPNGRWKLAGDQNENYNIWYEIAKPEADRRKLLLLHGTEITKSQMPPGHFNALFVQDVNPIAAAVKDWREMLQVAADQGAFLLWNHPGWQAPKSGGIEPGAPLRFTPEHEEVCQKGLMHGIEVFNGNEHYPAVSDWCGARDLAIFANSDIHPSEWNQYGHQNPNRPITLVLAKERTVESVKEAFFAKRTVAWAAGMLWGRDPVLPALFKAAVELQTPKAGKMQLVNKSSLPCVVKAGGMTWDLPPLETRTIDLAPGVKTLKVLNWHVATNTPLEVPVP